MDFSEHKFTKNEDGTFNILEVPIFELGSHRGFSYDENWSVDALNNFTVLKKEKKFLPRIIIGHTTENSEKPAVGFLDNLKLSGKQIAADLINLPTEIFEQIKKKAWPSRSVEVNPKKKKFTALALLGGTEPHFQFEPIDIKFQADPEGEWIELGDAQFLDKKSIVLQMWDRMLKVFKDTEDNNLNGDETMTPEELTKLKDDIKQEMSTELEAQFDTKYAEKFKEEFGKTPDEYKASVALAQTEKFQERTVSVIKKLKETSCLAPAIVDGFFAPLVEFAGNNEKTIKFAEKEQGTIFDLIEKFGESLKKHATEKTLIIDFKEHVSHDGDEDNPNFDSGDIDIIDPDEKQAAKIHREIEKYAEKHDVSYEDAADKVYEKFDEKK